MEVDGFINFVLYAGYTFIATILFGICTGEFSLSSYVCFQCSRSLSRFVCLPRATFHLFFLYQFRNIGILWLLFLRTHHLFSGESGLTRRDIRRGYKWFVNFKNKATRGTLKINFDEFQVGKEMAIIHVSLLKKVTLPEILLQYSL